MNTIKDQHRGKNWGYFLKWLISKSVNHAFFLTPGRGRTCWKLKNVDRNRAGRYSLKFGEPTTEKFYNFLIILNQLMYYIYLEIWFVINLHGLQQQGKNVFLSSGIVWYFIMFNSRVFALIHLCTFSVQNGRPVSLEHIFAHEYQKYQIGIFGLNTIFVL